MEAVTTTQQQAKAATPLQRFNRYLLNPGVQNYLDSVLSDRKASFVNNLVAIVSNNRQLQECEPSSIMNAAYKATALNLPIDPNLGMAYIIPYNNGKTGTTVAQFQMGYKGYIQLALRTGRVKTINVTDVREGEIRKRNRLSGEIEFDFIDDDAKRLATPIVGFAAYYEMAQTPDGAGGFSKMLYMSNEELRDHASKYSQTYKSKNEYIKKSSKWTTDFDAMAKKTVVKLLLAGWAEMEIERGKMSAETSALKDAITFDQAAINDDGTPDYVDGVDEQVNIAEAVEDKKETMRKGRQTAKAQQPEEAKAAQESEDMPEDGLF